jgi:two-component system, probable response regulator PhcQ
VNSPYRLMIVDDETNVLSALRRLINAAPWMYQGISYRPAVECFSSPLDAFERAKHCAFDLFIADYRMPEMDGVDFLSAVRTIQPQAARMILSGYADLNGLIGAINEARIYRFLSKPWNDYELVSAIAQALAYRDLLRENERLADEMRLQQGTMTKQQLEMKRLEAEEPGITHVKWGPDGSVLLD